MKPIELTVKTEIKLQDTSKPVSKEIESDLVYFLRSCAIMNESGHGYAVFYPDDDIKNGIGVRFVIKRTIL